MIDRLMSSYGASERRACHVLCVTRGTYRYRSCCDPRTELRMRIREIAQARVHYGYRKIRVLLNRESWDHAMDLWAYRNNVKIDFSRPGEPTDNAFVESFNGTFRREMPQYPLVPRSEGSKPADRGLEARIQ